MKYRAKTTFQHNGGLYVAGADVPVSGRMADVLVSLGRVESYEDRAVKAEPKGKTAKNKSAYKRRDMRAKEE